MEFKKKMGDSIEKNIRKQIKEKVSSAEVQKVTD
jgi:hypothetical protein